MLQWLPCHISPATNKPHLEANTELGTAKVPKTAADNAEQDSCLHYCITYYLF